MYDQAVCEFRERRRQNTYSPNGVECIIDVTVPESGSSVVLSLTQAVGTHTAFDNSYAHSGHLVVRYRAEHGGSVKSASVEDHR